MLGRTAHFVVSEAQQASLNLVGPDDLGFGGWTRAEKGSSGWPSWAQTLDRPSRFCFVEFCMLGSSVEGSQEHLSNHCGQRGGGGTWIWLKRKLR